MGPPEGKSLEIDTEQTKCHREIWHNVLKTCPRDQKINPGANAWGKNVGLGELINFFD